MSTVLQQILHHVGATEISSSPLFAAAVDKPLVRGFETTSAVARAGQLFVDSFNEGDVNKLGAKLRSLGERDALASAALRAHCDQRPCLCTPQLLRRQARTLCECFQLCPLNLRMRPAYVPILRVPAVCASNDVFLAHALREQLDTPGDEFRVFDDVADVSDDAREQNLTFRQL
jgi:hypothetical protein